MYESRDNKSSIVLRILAVTANEWEDAIQWMRGLQLSSEKKPVTRKGNYFSFRNRLRKASANRKVTYVCYFSKMELTQSLRQVARA